MHALKRLFRVSLLAVLISAGSAAADGIVHPDWPNTKSWLRQQDLTLTDSPREAVAAGYILVAGQGLPKVTAASPAQRKLTALRAAEVAAYRRLAEILDGVAVTGQTTVRDCSLESDTVKAAVQGLVKGARKVYEEWNPEEGVAVVFMQVGMHGSDSVAETLFSTYLNAATTRVALKTVAYSPSAEPVRVPDAAASASLPSAAKVVAAVEHDGLIVDASEQAFRPALINRIFSRRDEALYDPSRVSQKVLVEQGAGEYSNSVAKARAALEGRGTKSPMIVKVSGLKTPGDVYVSDEDAIQIYIADQKGNFLASAKVAFVLK